jgi:hypothetical protein
MIGVRRLLVALLALGVWLPSGALASQTATLSPTRFEPDRLGASTTVTIGFRIATPSGETPSPLVDVELSLPAGVTAGFNTLGLASCSPATLQERGASGCSPDAFVGRGSALVEVPFGAGVLYESVKTAILMGPLVDGHTAMSFYASGTSPVIAHLVFPTLFLGNAAPFGALLNTSIPPIAGLPGAPDVALVSMQSSIGPKGLKYYKRVHGATVAFAPEGFDVPSTCPAGGFPFAARFTFDDGSTESATSTAPCPPRGGHGRIQTIKR